MITLDVARERVKATIAGREDYVYPRSRAAGGDGKCVYFEADGTPSCLIGQAFADELRKADPDFDYNTEGVAALPDGLFDLPAVHYLSRVQDKQDTGWTWGNAVQDAEYVVPDIEAGKHHYY